MLQRRCVTKRSIDMTSDSGLTSQDTDYTKHIQEVLDELHQMQQIPRLVTSPEALEALEREIRQRTDRLGSLLVGHHLQHALDSAALQAEQAQFVHQWPTPLKNDGKVEVRVRTAQGDTGALRWTPKRYGRLPIATRHGPGWYNRSSTQRLRTPWRDVGW